MSIVNETKINKLLKDWPAGGVALSSWLADQGVSAQLLSRYKKSNWLEPIGSGAVKRSGETITYLGAIHALQSQAGSSIHPGARTALSLQGKSHYLELSTAKVWLFGVRGEKLPIWFKNYDWDATFDFHATTVFPAKLGLVDLQVGNLSVKVSSPARALMECLYLAPEKQELFECFELMEGLNNLRPKIVQELLEQCSSIKVKRLFMLMAEKAGHSWTKHVKLDQVDFGFGKRSLARNGIYNAKYKITVPKNLIDNE